MLVGLVNAIALTAPAAEFVILTVLAIEAVIAWEEVPISEPVIEPESEPENEPESDPVILVLATVEVFVRVPTEIFGV